MFWLNVEMNAYFFGDFASLERFSAGSMDLRFGVEAGVTIEA
jgi:hypothetical protein